MGKGKRKEKLKRKSFLKDLKKLARLLGIEPPVVTFNRGKGSHVFVAFNGREQPVPEEIGYGLVQAICEELGINHRYLNITKQTQKLVKVSIVKMCKEQQNLFGLDGTLKTPVPSEILESIFGGNLDE